MEDMTGNGIKRILIGISFFFLFFYFYHARQITRVLHFEAYVKASRAFVAFISFSSL